MKPDITTIRTYLASQEDAHLKELFAFLRLPSVSTDPTHQADVRQAAEWVATRLEQAGVPEVTLAEAGGHPAVLGRWHVADDQPTVLLYGHYDVQPEAPVDLWQSPAFEPEIRDGRIYARGSSDMKGNLLTVIHGVEAAAHANGGTPPINVAFIFEGEEEIGSPSLLSILEQNRDLLQADVVVSADGGQHDEDTPAMTLALKGLAAVQINLRTAQSDLHSGMYGAWVPNAAQSLVQLAATFHDSDGRIAVEGFYDDVVDLTERDREEIAVAVRDDDAALQELGVRSLWGEPGYTSREREWARPTVDFNGVWGGFQGEGTKTVTPNEAHLKITCRLVPNQDPQRVIERVRAHVAMHSPASATVEVVPGKGSAEPFMADRDNAFNVAIRKVLTEVFGRAPVMERSGGSIPATAIFQQALGLDTTIFAWSQPNSGLHAPNEWYRVEDFTRGRYAYAALLAELKRS